VLIHRFSRATSSGSQSIAIAAAGALDGAAPGAPAPPSAPELSPSGTGGMSPTRHSDWTGFSATLGLSSSRAARSSAPG
jgi:hypothetical protein